MTIHGKPRRTWKRIHVADMQIGLQKWLLWAIKNLRWSRRWSEKKHSFKLKFLKYQLLLDPWNNRIPHSGNNCNVGNEHFQAIIAAYRILLIDILAHSSRNTGLFITGTTPASTSVTASWLRALTLTCSRAWTGWRPPKKNPGGAHPTGENFRFRAHGSLSTNKNLKNISVSWSYEHMQLTKFCRGLVHLYIFTRVALTPRVSVSHASVLQFTIPPRFVTNYPRHDRKARLRFQVLSRPEIVRYMVWNSILADVKILKFHTCKRASKH